MDTDRFLVYTWSKYIYSDILKDAATKSDTSNYESDRPLSEREKT